MTTVFNLAANEMRAFSCGPREAAIAAYAQNLGDFNTWDYARKYGDLVRESELAVYCGSFGAFKEPRSAAQGRRVCVQA